ncbi:apicoplast ribosomal protein L4 (apicoplast) [Plasmodium vinckei vinckei]|uniref:Large ribosomal subunit protein uL4m n=1 Tax=Plasmodium vinckei vinckei TaxID=54757 RepID=A0A449C190_PLAVN|nr:apicoplast ribosomal protein L4 [Plasmodium vinckei vinckei]VEV59455.1 apicoplast ribosomal protein L4 [Plasmodium vinckei vinckei]
MDNIIILNINNNIFNNNIIFKYKYDFFIKLYLNNYIKIYKLLIYIIKYYYLNSIYKYKNTKNRSLINFSKKKIRVQKGTGKARLKTLSSTVCKQGSCTFGPFYKNKIIKYNKFIYKLIFIYLLINKRSNILIIKFEYILCLLYIYRNINFNIKELIYKILYLNGVLLNKNYKILNLYEINNKYILLNLILYNYIIFIV